MNPRFGLSDKTELAASTTLMDSQSSHKYILHSYGRRVAG